MSWYNGEIENAVGWGDISHASGYGGPPYIMGNMVDPTQNPYAIINPMARYKPIRFNTWGILTDQNRADARHGFSTSNIPYWTPTASGCPKNNWVYLRPRGASYNEPYRALDFLSAPGSTVGYNARIAAPIAAVSGGSPQVGQDYGFWIPFNGNASNEQAGKVWNQYEGLSLQDLLESASDFYNYHITVLLYDNNNNTWNIVTYKTTLAQAIQSNSSGFVPMLYNTAGTESGVYHPAVPFLAESSHNDHDITFVIGLRPEGPSSDLYSISTQSLDIYSLGFVDGCDRFTVKFGSAISIMGLDGSIVNNSTHPIALSNPTEITVGQTVWVRYAISNSIWGSFSTPGSWGRTNPPNPDHTTNYFTITITNGTGLIGTSSAPGDSGQKQYSANSQVFAASASNDNRELLSSVGDYFWMPKAVAVASRYVKIDLLAYAIDTGESKQLNGATIYATS